MNGTPDSSSRTSGAVVFDSCMRERVPSCIRAPPEAQTTIAGIRSANAVSKQRASFSPTTLPMLPPMNRKSKIAIATRTRSISPIPHTRASRSPVFTRAASSRSG